MVGITKLQKEIMEKSFEVMYLAYKAAVKFVDNHRDSKYTTTYIDMEQIIKTVENFKDILPPESKKVVEKLLMSGK